MENQVFGTEILNSTKTSARSSVGSAMIGLLVTITNAFLQVLMIYWILGAFGTQFNGFIRVSMALSIVGGTSEGALGITTVILMAKPILDKDWIVANEIFSTSKRQYRKKFWRGLIFVLLISITYPLFIVFSPTLAEGTNAQWTIPVSSGINSVHVWQLGFICFMFGFKQVISSCIFGIYENILEADKENYLRRAIILFTDIFVYVWILIMLNISYSQKIDAFIPPVVTFTPILIYSFIRGVLIRWYVLKKCTWIKFYSDFNDYKLKRNSNKLFFSSMSLNILMNFDIFIIFIILGSSGLKISSMLSIYMIIALNIRVIMLTFITSFREYFLLIILKEGRLSWEKYIKYEMYTYVIAAFNFIVMAILTRFLTLGLYADVLVNTEDANSLAEAYGLKFIFEDKLFSILFAATTSGIIIIQGQFVLIQAKGTAKKITKAVNITTFVYLTTSVVLLFILYKTNAIDSSQNDWIGKMLTGFYVMKLVFISIIYFTLWFYTWKYVTYNSSTKGVLSNLIFMIIPIIVVIVFMYYFLDNISKININIFGDEENLASITIVPIRVSSIASILLLVVFLSLPLCLILPIIFNPKVGLSMVLNIPIFKKLLEKQKISSKLQRFAQAGFDEESATSNDQFIQELYNNFQDDKDENVFTLNEDMSRYQEKYNYKKTPKIYTVKNKEKSLNNKRAKKTILKVKK